nr:ribonuclease H-like domain-containing protein [Tanacetum cinerariifolium]
MVDGNVNNEGQKISKEHRKEVNLNGNETVAFDKTKVECYNFHKSGHFVRGCRAPKAQKEMYLLKLLTPQLWCHVMDLEVMIGVTKMKMLQLTLHSWHTSLQVLILRQKISKAAITVNTARPVNTAHPKTIMNAARPRPKAVVNTTRPKIVLNVVKGNEVYAVKASACWVWKPKIKILDHVSKHNNGNLQQDLQEKGMIDIGCSRHMTRNMSYLTDYKEIDRGYVAFGGNPKRRKITSKENLVDHKVKVIRCDNGTEFKNRNMNQFCKIKGIMRQYSVARTPQQSGVAKRRNKTLIKAARTMLADSKLPTTFWAKAINIASYVQNMVLVTKPHNKTPYELLHGRTPTLSFMRSFGCPITILNTIDHLGKFDGKFDEGFFIGYSLNRKAFRVFNNRTRIVEETLHIKFSENTPNNVGSRPNSLFDIDALTKTVSYQPGVAGTQSNGKAGTKDNNHAGQARKEKEPIKDYILLPLWTANPPFPQEPKSSQDVGFKPFNDVGKKELCTSFEKLMHDKFQMSSIEELTFFFGLQVKQKENGIFISQDKYVAEILKKFGFFEVKTASTPMETEKPLLKDEDGKEVDVHIYRLMIGSLMYLTSSRLDIMFACKKQIVVGNSTTEAEFIQIFLDKQLDGLPTHKEKYDVSFHTKKVFANMKIIEGGGNSLVRATTTTSSLEAEHANDNIATTQTNATSNETSSQGTSLGDGLKRQDTMGVPLLILERRVKKLEKKHRSRTHKLRRLYKVGLTARVIRSSNDEALDKEDTSKQRRIDEINVDVDIALVSAHNDELQDEGMEDIGEQEVVEVVTTAKMLIDTVVDAAQVATAIADDSAAETIVTTALTIIAESTKTNVEEDIQAKVDADYQLAERLQVEEQEKLTDAKKAKLFMEFIEKRRNFFAAKKDCRKEKQTTYQSSTKEYYEINNFIDFKTELVEVSTKKDKAETAQESSSKRARDELDQERSKKQKVKDDKEYAELKQCLEIILNDEDEVTIDATPLSVKTLIVEYNIYKERKKNYF